MVAQEGAVAYVAAVSVSWRALGTDPQMGFVVLLLVATVAWVAVGGWTGRVDNRDSEWRDSK